MRVTFILPQADLSGGVRIVDQHARMLHNRGHKVTVVTLPQHTPALKMWMKALLGKRPFSLKKINLSHLDDAPYLVHTIDSHRPVVTDDVPDADIIIATWWLTAEWVSVMPDTKGLKVNFLQHYEAHQGIPADRVEAVWKLPMHKIVVSRWLENIAKEQFGDPTAILVPNGLDTQLFRYVERTPSGQGVVGGMNSGLDKSSFKRFWLAVETMRELNKRKAECRFIGFGTHEVKYAELPHKSFFETAPKQSRIAEIYSQCDCWLFTSEKEGYGLPLLEAMSCGTPVVATPAGAAPELLQSGGGYLVDSSDPVVLADAVQTILSLNANEWQAMSRRAREEAEKHSWTIIGGRMETALQQILEESGRMKKGR